MLTVLDLFSGIGGFSLGLERTGGFKTVAFCEIDPFCRKVLAKHWPDVPIHDDVTKLRGEDVGSVDVICGGFPCQDLSYAGQGLGLAGERSGLWSEIARLVRALRPRFVIVENVAALLARGMGDVLGDLAGLGYDAEWSSVSACSVGAPHMRQRVFIVAYPDSFDGWSWVRDTSAQSNGPLPSVDSLESARSGWRARMANPSELYRGADGVPFGMDRTRATGNSVVPQVVEMIGHAILDAPTPRVVTG
ncbi:MAG: DNA cytosine methyltransferase [Aestuariivirgaceae bacterium]